MQLQQVGYEEELGLERNLNFLTSSFFNAFQAVKDVQTAAGVSYAVANRDVLRNEELGLVYGLEPGNEQLLNGKEAEVSNLGFFYVLRSVPMLTHNQKFLTPAWTIKAWAHLSFLFC